jgi:AbrB family looped-hinge helix DNA binding protein
MIQNLIKRRYNLAYLWHPLLSLLHMRLYKMISPGKSLTMEIAKISPKGQEVIPASIRKMMEIRPSDRFLVFGKEDF